MEGTDVIPGKEPRKGHTDFGMVFFEYALVFVINHASRSRQRRSYGRQNGAKAKKQTAKVEVESTMWPDSG